MNQVEITIQQRTRRGWPVVVDVRQADSLPQRSQGFLQVENDEDFHQTLRAAYIEAQSYGEILGRAVFSGQQRDLFLQARVSARDIPLQVLLVVEAPDLQGLYWERLCAPAGSGWELLALSQQTPLSRYLPTITDRHFAPFGKADLRALIVMANPPNEDGPAQFDEAATLQGLEVALGPIPFHVLGTVPGAIGPPTLSALCAQLTAERYTILHLVAHGRLTPHNGSAAILLHDAQGELTPIMADELLTHLGYVRQLPQNIFLSSCDTATPVESPYGNLAHRLVTILGIPAVVAMSEPVTITTATVLAESYYRQLRDHGQVDLALTEARAALLGKHDIVVPGLYSRLDGRPLIIDTIDRPLTPAEYENGLEHLESLVAARAPVLSDQFTTLRLKMTPFVGTEETTLVAEARADFITASEGLDDLTQTVAEISFSALATGRAPVAYETAAPFPGLEPFSVAEKTARFFFGRDTLVAELINRLERHSFLAVMGPSGCGKSSLVRAGLIGQLKESHPELKPAILRPSDLLRDDNQVADLESTLDDKHTLLVIDQFEEVFTLWRDDIARRHFFDQLLAQTPRRPVVLTMRADFWGDCAPYRALKTAMQVHQYLVEPLVASELRSVMEQQAAAVGLRFEAGLAQRIFGDVASEPGAMPLLQHALRQTWVRRHGRWLRTSEYESIGGVAGAIAKTAQDSLDAATPEEQRLIRHILLRLTRLGEDEQGTAPARRDTRRRRSHDDLVPAGESPEQVRELVNRLADKKLLITDGESSVEIAHEALIQHWPELKRWLEQNPELLRLQDEIGRDAQRYHLADEKLRKEHLLLQGTRLAQVEGIIEANQLTLSNSEQAYVHACRAEQQRRTDEEDTRLLRELELAEQTTLAEARARAEAMAREREQLLAAVRLARRLLVAVVLGVIAIIAAIVAVVAGLNANESANANATQIVIASTAQAQAESNLARATAALVEAATSEAKAIAARSTAEAEGFARATQAAIAQDEAAARSTQAAIADKNAAIGLSRQLANQSLELLSQWQTEIALLLAIEAGAASDTHEAFTVLRAAIGAPGRVIHILEHDDRVRDVVWSPDGSRLLSASDDNTARVWDVATGEELLRLEHMRDVEDVGWSPSGRYIGTFDAFDDVRIWDVDTGVELGMVPRQGFVRQPEWNHDESQLLLVDDDTILVWDATSGEISVSLQHQAAVNQASWSVSSEQILTASVDKTARVWDALTGEELIRLEHDNTLWQAMWNKNETQILTASADNTARIWDAVSGEQIVELLHDGFVMKAFWNDNESRVLSVGDDHTVRVWDAQTGVQLFVFEHDRDINQVRWSNDTGHILTASDDETAKVWDSETGIQLFLLQHDGDVTKAVWNDAENRILTVSDDDTVRVWDGDTGQNLLLIRENALDAHWSEDQSRILTRGADLVRYWDSETGTELATFNTRWATWNQDESRLMSFGGNEIRLWDAEPGAEISVMQHPPQRFGNVWQAVWSPDGNLVATYQNMNRIAHVWDADTGRALAELEHSQAITQLAWSSDGTQILATGGGSYLHEVYTQVWDLETGESFTLRHIGDDWGSHSSWSPDESLILTRTGRYNLARLWDATTGAELAVLEHEDDIWHSSWSPRGDRVVTASFDNTARVWNVVTGIELATLQHDGDVWEATFNSDGTRILTRSADKTIRIWDVASGDAISVFQHDDDIWQASWNPDENLVLTRNNDMSILVWDVETNTQVANIQQDDSIVQATWNSEGTRILTRDLSTLSVPGPIVRVWDLFPGGELVSLEHESGVSQANWSGDGARIMTRSGTSVQVWDSQQGVVLVRLDHDEGVNQALWSSDENLILTVAGNVVTVWQAVTGVALMTVQQDTSVAYANWSHNEDRILVSSGDGTVSQYYLSMDDLILAACAMAPRQLNALERQRYFNSSSFEATCNESDDDSSSNTVTHEIAAILILIAVTVSVGPNRPSSLPSVLGQD